MILQKKTDRRKKRIDMALRAGGDGPKEPVKPPTESPKYQQHEYKRKEQGDHHVPHHAPSAHQEAAVHPASASAKHVPQNYGDSVSASPAKHTNGEYAPPSPVEKHKTGYHHGTQPSTNYYQQPQQQSFGVGKYS